MIKSVTVTNYLGESVKITLTEGNPDHGLIVIGMDGIGAPEADINTTAMATTDGSLYNSARAEERNIVLQFMFSYAPRIEDARQQTYKFFPIKKEVELLIETDNRSLKIKGYVEKNEPDIFSDEESCQISIICPDPFFQSTREATTIFSGIEPMFEFSFSNESLTEKLLIMGEILNQTERTVPYEGDADVGVTITIHALDECGDITIYNVRTRESMTILVDKIAALVGGKIRAGDDIIITTARGEKGALFLRDGHYTNILNCIDKGSDWFRLAKGDNIFAYVTDFGAEELQFMITNKILYEGI